MLTTRDLRYAFHALSTENGSEGAAQLCLFYFSGLRVVRKAYEDGAWICRQKGGGLVKVNPAAIARGARRLSWLYEPASPPVLLPKMGGARTHIAANFVGVPFNTYLQFENIRQGLLQNPTPGAAQALARLAYPRMISEYQPDQDEEFALFFWANSVSLYLANLFPNLFKPAPAGAAPDPRGVMNAQIRMLTKGDVTKTLSVLDTETHTALAELDARAREIEQQQKALKK